jgi:hypothetical protein
VQYQLYGLSNIAGSEPVEVVFQLIEPQLEVKILLAKLRDEVVLIPLRTNC